jgi:hypothetical protein
MKDIVKKLELINVMEFKYKNKERKNDEEEYNDEIYKDGKIDVKKKVDGKIRWWIEKGVKEEKIIIGIGNFGVKWKMKKERKIYGVNKIGNDGKGEKGNKKKNEGIM